MLELDRNTPFVAQVFAFMRGEVSAETCVQTLRQSERKWNVEHIAPSLEVYVEDYEIKTRSPERFSHIIGLNEENGLWEKYVTEQYYGFLSETHLILDTCCYSDVYDIVLANKYSFQATARAWGKMYAEWANRVIWLECSGWTYLDFYSELHRKIDGFSEWADAVYHILLLKTDPHA